VVLSFHDDDGYLALAGAGPRRSLEYEQMIMVFTSRAGRILVTRCENPMAHASLTAHLVKYIAPWRSCWRKRLLMQPGAMPICSVIRLIFKLRLCWYLMPKSNIANCASDQRQVWQCRRGDNAHAIIL
jgi:hypothetical protein